MNKTMREKNVITLLENSAIYSAAHTLLKSWDEGIKDYEGFVGMLLAMKRGHMHYLYQSCTHPDTYSEHLAQLIVDMVCHTMNHPESRALLTGAFQTYEFMDELADYLNQMLAAGCREGRPEFLVAAKIMAPEWVWRPVLEPQPLTDEELDAMEDPDVMEVYDEDTLS